jgi:hypothetical protein
VPVTALTLLVGWLLLILLNAVALLSELGPARARRGDRRASRQAALVAEYAAALPPDELTARRSPI